MATEAPKTAPAMPPTADYFDTDRRSQCVNLIIHLLHNTREMPCVCGPRGLGKTTFANHLATLLREDFRVLSVPLKTGEELAVAVARQLGLPPSPMPADWDAVIESSSDDKPLLVIVDDGERLTANAQQAMLDMADAGVRFVLVGAGLASPALRSHIREIDLPAFSLEETKEFVAYLGRRAGVSVSAVDVARLFKTSQGLPGLIIDQMEGRTPPRDARSRRAPGGGRTVTALILLAAVVLLALWFQDDINRLFEDGAASDDYQTLLPLPPQQPVVAAPESSEPAPLHEAPLPQMGDIEQTEPPATPVTKEHKPEEAVATIAQAPEPAPDVEITNDEAATDERVQTANPAHAMKEIAPATPPPAESQPDAPAADTVAKEKAEVTADSSETWLRTQPPGHYTLQLVGARERSAIERFVQEHGLPRPYGVIVRELNGRPWYSLVWGAFPDRGSALAASRQLPAAVRKDVWPRSFASVQDQLGN